MVDVAKILVVGDGQVGKTTLLKTLTDDAFHINGEIYERRTVMFDFHYSQIEETKLIWFDIAGQHNEGISAIEDMNRFILGKTRLLILVFSLERFQSFTNLSLWYEVLKKSNEELKQSMPEIIVVGNKKDLALNFDNTMVNHLVETNPDFNCYFEISCLTMEGIDELRRCINNWGFFG